MKRKRLKNIQAQSIIEYVVVFAVIVVALIVMQAVVRGGIAGRYKTSVDSGLGKPFDPFDGKYTADSYTEGEVAFANRQESAALSGDDTENATYAASYQVFGPDGYTDPSGKVVIAPDPTRKPYTSTNYKRSEIDWKK